MRGLLIALLGVAMVPFAVSADSDSGEWIQLFNGENLAGWVPKFRGYELGKNYKNTFRVEDGLLKVSYDEYEEFNNRFGHLFYHQPFSNYMLRVEYRFVGEQTPGGPGWAFRNNGIMIHGQDPATMEINQNFPVSIEIQLLGGDGQNERPNANVCTPGTHVVIDGELITRHYTQADAPTFHGDQWVVVEAEVRGSEVIRHIVNGEVVLEYNEPQLDPNSDYGRKMIPEVGKLLEGGTISIQAESHPTHFRRIEVKQLN